jgi:hypothetical protein
VGNARGLGASRFDETRRGDAGRDGHLWRQQHGWGFTKGVTRGLKGQARKRIAEERAISGSTGFLSWPRPGNIYMYATREEARTKRIQRTYEYGSNPIYRNYEPGDVCHKRVSRATCGRGLTGVAVARNCGIGQQDWAVQWQPNLTRYERGLGYERRVKCAEGVTWSKTVNSIPISQLSSSIPS